MAFVPELDDPNKKDESPDASDLSAQTASTPSAAPATGGQAVGGNPANSSSKSSGNFQDFSKFKAANQNKLSALSNLATDQAQGSVNKAKSAFDNAGSAFQTEIQKNAKNFDTSAYKDMNVDSKVDADAFGKDLSEANQKQDAGSYQGKLAGTEAFTGLQSAENQVGKLGTRAGTAGVLGQYGADTGNYSGAAANQDALLLQSMGDYRQKANQIAQTTKGTTEAAYQQNKDKIAATAKSVDDGNQEYRTKALDALKGVKDKIDLDLAGRGASAEADRQTKIGSKVAETQQAIQNSINSKVQSFQATPPPSLKAPGKDLFGRTVMMDNQNYAAQKADYDAQAAEIKRITNLSPEQRLQEYGANDLVSGLKAGSITGDNILRTDTNRQQQLDALARLGIDSGNVYGEGGLDPQSDVSGLDALIASLKGSVSAPKSAAAVPTPTPQTSSASIGNKKQEAKILSNAPGIR